MRISLKIIAGCVLFLAFVLTGGCERTNTASGPAAGPDEPSMDVTPIQSGGGQWKIASSPAVTVTVTAPGAKDVKIFYQPEAASDRYIELKAPVHRDQSNGKFTSNLRLPQDFAGEVWAEISYPDGSTKETQPIALAAAGAVDQQQQGEVAGQPAPTPTPAAPNANNSGPPNQKTQAGNAQPQGQPDVRITVNVPAFRLILWQNGSQVQTYEIGVGRKEFPIVIGKRKAWQIIWNPEWVPPDSVWVQRMRGVSPGEHLEAGDPHNPLGKIKIPLGDGYLIHQAESSKDIGHLVSHGCVRMRLEDLTDLVQKLITARALPVSQDQINQAMATTERLVVKLNPPLPVEIDYDTLVVENGILHVYPDVYDRGTNAVDNLRSKLQSAGVDASKVDDQTLAAIMNRANRTEEFQVSLSDIGAGRALIAGQNQPLTSQSVPPHVAKAAHPARRRRSR
ncbi:MAG TPA: L,D-transpeptidase [Blastocatellia bacterium]|nr:L,D-transpeptidase [Blastocatellia bacterium]